MIVTARGRRLCQMSSVCVIMLVGGCSSDVQAPGTTDTTTRNSTLKGLIVSNATLQPTSSSAIKGVAALAGESSVAYVSVPAGTLAGIAKVVIENLSRHSESYLVFVIDGGFDPIGIPATVDDSLRLTPDNGDSPLIIKVPSRRPPTIVRSSPSKGRTDVAMNVIITVIFTEPVHVASSVEGAIKLQSGSQEISGTVELADDGLSARFRPATVLAPNTDYSASVKGGAILDGDGDSVGSDLKFDFATGADVCSIDFETRDCPLPSDIYGVEWAAQVVDVSHGAKRPIPDAEVWTSFMVNDTSASVTVNARLTNSLGKVAMFYFPNKYPHSAWRFYTEPGGLDQPCVATAAEGETALLEVPVVAAGSRINITDSASAIWGVVYEKVGTGKRPLADGHVFFESPKGVNIANATTGADGSFMLCNLPQDGAQFLTVTHVGYQPLTVPAKHRGLYTDYELIISR